ncbi:MAG: fructose-6-phosphate aldolase [Deltaproteobacteria bacterium]|nr:fructose-6-phosphate aldolase [Deltaproteobacteria bacterium]MBI2501353.1 fructose-6-phosphate aldolase [Deltaproteobacteria bacterium]
MQFFIDSADVKEIRDCWEMGVIDGVTTNPSLAAKTGRNYNETIKEIAGIVDGPISAETISLDFEGMMREAYHFAKIHKNIVVKIPMTPTGLKAVKQCSKDGIKTNVTVTFTANQALLIAKAGATYVSPFVGRLDDISEEGMEVIRHIRQIYDNYDFKTKILVASVRHPIHVRDAALIGADVATIPYNVLLQLSKHPLTDAGIEKFLKDWEKVPK